MISTFTKLTAAVTMSSMLMLTACGQAPAPVAAPQQPMMLQPTTLQPVAKAATPSAILADVGNGLKTPAKLNFSINLDQLEKFQTKASTPGTAAKTKTDLTNLKFYLVESDTGTPPTALSGSGFTYTVSADNKTNNRVDITFTNVAANATDKSYYVAVAGFSSASYIAANNITNLIAPINDATEGKFYVSNSGGSPLGAVRVTPTTYALSSTSALAVPLKLLDAVSPILDSDVNITSGDEITGGPSGSGS